MNNIMNSKLVPLKMKKKDYELKDYHINAQTSNQNLLSANFARTASVGKANSLKFSINNTKD